jgi:hypothetical protein
VTGRGAYAIRSVFVRYLAPASLIVALLLAATPSARGAGA